jgi:anaerobic magnesium-protoporphyrin IX monomethyl ester cyclase
LRVLLISMPDTVSALDPVLRVPNLGLCSLAGNLEGNDVKVLDLVFYPQHLTRQIRDIVGDFRPDIIGLSAMSYQYASAREVSSICRQVDPAVKVVLGGYHATLMSREIAASPDAKWFDLIVRGEGEMTFRNLVGCLNAGGTGISSIPGLSYRDGDKFNHNADALPVELDRLKLPDRDCRIADRAQFLGKSFDCVETSRGCTMGCRFCSIELMYGRAVRKFALERVISDLKLLKQRGKQGIFFVDDNITLDVPRFKNLCSLIIREKLDTLTYVVQAGVPGIASDTELPELMKRAGFKWVFLGIESGISRNLESMGKRGVLNNTRRAVSLLKEQGIGIFGGFIIGHPEDTNGDIRATYKFALELGVDHPIIQCLTPYPKTQTRDELLARGLVTNTDDFSLYNGFTCNVRTLHLSNRQVNRVMFWSGFRLYFNPRYLIKSRFWRLRLLSVPALLLNNLRYLAGAINGKIFVSRHTW